MMKSCLLVVAVLATASGSRKSLPHDHAVAPAAAYWTSNPNYAGETVTVAGSFDGSERLELCPSVEDTSCQATQGDIWNYSIKVVLPHTHATPPRPVWLRVTSENGAVLSLPLNAPDVWWFASLSPVGGPVDISSSEASPGSTLRVFGRALAWDGNTCVSAQKRAACTTTQVLLTPADGAGDHACCHQYLFDYSDFCS
jgi:hypothetical protein